MGKAKEGKFQKKIFEDEKINVQNHLENPDNHSYEARPKVKSRVFWVYLVNLVNLFYLPCLPGLPLGSVKLLPLVSKFSRFTGNSIVYRNHKYCDG